MQYLLRDAGDNVKQLHLGEIHAEALAGADSERQQEIGLCARVCQSVVL